MNVPSPFPTRAERAAAREQKREAVLRGAVRLFNAHGFHATALEDVAASLRISKPTIYRYLGNKEQVLIECVTRGLDLLTAAAAEAAARPGTGIDRLRHFLLRYAAINMDDFGRCVIRTGEEALSADGARRFRERKRAVDGALRDMVAAGVADGSIVSSDVKLTAFAIAGALNWPARWHDPDGAATPEAIAAHLVDTLIAGLAPRAG